MNVPVDVHRQPLESQTLSAFGRGKGCQATFQSSFEAGTETGHWSRSWTDRYKEMLSMTQHSVRRTMQQVMEPAAWSSERRK